MLAQINDYEIRYKYKIFNQLMIKLNTIGFVPYICEQNIDYNLELHRSCSSFISNCRNVECASVIYNIYTKLRLQARSKYLQMARYNLRVDYT